MGALFALFWWAINGSFLFGQNIDASLIQKKLEGGGASFSAQNNERVPVYVALRFTRLEGLDADKAFPLAALIPPGTTEDVITLRPQANARTMAYRISYQFLYVDPASVHPDGYAYYLPFAHGARHTVTQGWNGAFSHVGQNRYAVDFDLPEGSPVYAAREGVVIAVKSDSRRGGPSASYTNDANFIFIRHPDNTVGSYVHLMYGGAAVRPGDSVAAGDLIGYSGNTGFSSGPHLHFDVRAADLEQGMQSIPFSFRDRNGNAVQPVTNGTYYGRFPGGPDFTELHGDDITEAMFVNFSAPAAPPKTGSGTGAQPGAQPGIGLRKDSYDDAVVLFISNTFSYAIDARVTLGLSNLTFEQPMPVSVHIPAGTEVFLGLARIQNMQNPIAIRMSAQYMRAPDPSGAASE